MRYEIVMELSEAAKMIYETNRVAKAVLLKQQLCQTNQRKDSEQEIYKFTTRHKNQWSCEG